MTMVLIQQLNEAEKKTNRAKMHIVVEKLVELAMEGGGALYDAKGKLIKRYGDLEAIKYLFDRLEGRPAQSMGIFKDNLVRVEFRSYEEIRDGLMEQGIDIERLPASSGAFNKLATSSSYDTSYSAWQ
jgi:hypothetical protein